RYATDILMWGSRLLVLYLVVVFILTRFPYTEPWGAALGSWLWNTIRGLGLRAIATIPGLFTIAIVMAVTKVVSRAFGAFFDAIEAKRMTLSWMHPDIVPPTRRIVSSLLWLFAIVASYPYMPGSTSGVFKGVSVFLGLMVTLGSSGLIGQAISGFILMYSRAFRRGEYVRIGEIEGTVMDLGVLSTKVRTVKQELMSLPNSLVLTTGTRNYSRHPGEHGILLHTSVTIGYDAPWRL